MAKDICISRKEYKKLKDDEKIVDTISKLDNSVVKSINRSLKQASQGYVRRIA